MRLEALVGNPPDMPELTDDGAAPRVHRLCDPAPGLDLLFCMNARCRHRPGALDGNLGGLGDDQARAGALRVVGDNRIRWCPLRTARSG